MWVRNFYSVLEQAYEMNFYGLFSSSFFVTDSFAGSLKLLEMYRFWLRQIRILYDKMLLVRGNLPLKPPNTPFGCQKYPKMSK